jgi:hypothetical protein
VSADGGSEILSYSLEIDDGEGGDFKPVVGYSSVYLLQTFGITDQIEKGTVYRLRYRVKNAIGWSDYSPLAYIQAASKPVAPDQPIYVSSSSTSVTLTIPPSIDDQGSPIIKYKLFVDSGNDFSSEFT